MTTLKDPEYRDHIIDVMPDAETARSELQEALRDLVKVCLERATCKQLYAMIVVGGLIEPSKATAPPASRRAMSEEERAKRRRMWTPEMREQASEKTMARLRKRSMP